MRRVLPEAFDPSPRPTVAETPLVHATASQGAVNIGALAVGDIKYKLQQALLRAMLESEQPVYLDFRDAFQRARDLV